MIEKKDHKSLNHIQMHKLIHFLEKNIPWLNLVLVLLLIWSIVLCIPSGYDKTMKPKFRLINETEEYYDYYSYETERFNLSETSLENHN